jgi:hypothetical protein
MTAEIRNKTATPAGVRRLERGARVHFSRIRREERWRKGRTLRRLSSLCRGGGRGSARPGSRLPGRGGRLAYTPARFLQRSVVKVSYARNAQKRGWYGHGRYLARAGAQREHERGLGFDAESDEIHLEKRVSSWEREKDPRLWKVIVSPEHGHHLDLRSHARQFVDRVERDLGRRLEWVAIDHHDTWHPHVHVLIRGVDQEGRTFLIPQEYVRSGMRRRSRELATRELGLRREREISLEMQIRQELGKEIKRKRSRSRPHARAERLLPPREREGGLERERVLERPRSVPIDRGPQWD